MSPEGVDAPVLCRRCRACNTALSSVSSAADQLCDASDASDFSAGVTCFTRCLDWVRARKLPLDTWTQRFWTDPLWSVAVDQWLEAGAP